jgi:hypothetical protein
MSKPSMAFPSRFTNRSFTPRPRWPFRGEAPPSALHLIANCKLLQDRFNRHSEEARNLILSAAICEQFSTRMREDPANKRLMSLGTAKISVGHTVDDQDCVVLSMRNESGITLHNVLGFARVEVNQAAMDNYERDYRNDKLPKALLFQMAGFEMFDALEADMAVMAYQRLTKNVPIFIREWPLNGMVKFRMARG